MPPGSLSLVPQENPREDPGKHLGSLGEALGNCCVFNQLKSMQGTQAGTVTGRVAPVWIFGSWNARRMYEGGMPQMDR